MLPLRFRNGTTFLDVREASEELRSWFRCARIEVLPASEDGSRAELVLFHSALPEASEYPFRPERLVPRRAWTGIPLGVDAHDETVSLRLFDFRSGASSLLIGGVPGSGKSNALRTVVFGLSQVRCCLVFIDPAGGAEARRWGSRVRDVVEGSSADEAAAKLDEVLSLINARGQLLAAGLHPGELLPVCLVCDELAELGAAGTPREQEAVRAQLRRIVATGRKANVACVMATQRTTATSIDVTTRSLVAWRLALAHPDDRHGSEALLGAGRHEASTLTRNDVGVGFLTDGGAPRLLRVFAVTDEMARRNSSDGLAESLSEVRAWDEVRRHEMCL